MKLLYQTHSPYARKALVMAYETGLVDRLEVIHHETSPTRRNEEVQRLNPLGKVPVLICDDGFVLFDSSVICDYLDGLHSGPKLIPERGPERLAALRLQALAQGLCDAGIALRWETVRRPEALRYPPMRDGQTVKLTASYDFIEREVALDGALTIGHIALATALSWIEFRNLPGFDRHPRLAAWHRAFSRRPSMEATRFTGETYD